VEPQPLLLPAAVASGGRAGDRRHRADRLSAQLVGRAVPEAGAAMKQALRQVRWLAELSEEALDDVIEAGQEVRFAAGRTLVGELESGDDLFVLTEGS